MLILIMLTLGALVFVAAATELLATRPYRDNRTTAERQAQFELLLRYSHPVSLPSEPMFAGYLAD